MKQAPTDCSVLLIALYYWWPINVFIVLHEVTGLAISEAPSFVRTTWNQYTVSNWLHML